MTAGGARPRAATLALAAALFAGGCAAPQTAALRAPAVVQALPRQASVAGVPFFAQNDYQCGPAALAMALGAIGRSRTPDSLADEVYLPLRQGTLQAEMLALPRREGLLAVRMPVGLAALLRTIADGHAVVVFQNLGLAMMPVWHYAVMIGYDLDAEQVLLHSGTREAMPISMHTFERTWARGGSWAMVVTTPTRIPATAPQSEALRAAVSLERSDRAAALAAYRALRARDPQDRLTLFALANGELADGRPRDAVNTYRELLRLHPGFGAGWNNLAEALARIGDPVGAREAAQRAVSIGGPGSDAYRETAAGLR